MGKIETAYHEAGHVVALLVIENQPNPTSCSIIPNIEKNYKGVTTFASGDCETLLDRIFEKVTEVAEPSDDDLKSLKNYLDEAIIVLLSGWFSEINYNPDLDDEGYLDDVKKITIILQDNGFIEYDGDKDLKRLVKQCKQLIKRHWDLIVDVANLLIEKETLSIDDLRKYY